MKLLILTLSLLTMLLFSQEPQVAPAKQPGLSTECLEILQETLKDFPGIATDEMLSFYRENAPDLVAEWEKRCTISKEKGLEYSKLLVNNYNSIARYKEKSPEEYSRLVKQQKNESLIRMHSRSIQELARIEAPTAEDKAKLTTLKLELKKIMEDAFDEAQRYQQIEINRLENNLRELKALADQRAANKQAILQQRFILLTDGQEWPK